MRKIADRIEYSATAIYFHFKDKDTLLRELCAQDFLALAETFARLAAVKDPIDRLKRLGRAYVKFALEHPQHYRLMFMTSHPVVADETNRGIPERDAYCFVRRTVDECISTRRLIPTAKDPDLVAQMIWGAVHGIVALRITMGDDKWIEWKSLEKTTTFAIDTLLSGLVAE
jgi:AcrR family transcriptional regulator